MKVKNIVGLCQLIKEQTGTFLSASKVETFCERYGNDLPFIAELINEKVLVVESGELVQDPGAARLYNLVGCAAQKFQVHRSAIQHGLKHGMLIIQGNRIVENRLTA